MLFLGERGWGWVGPEMNMFEHVSSDHHQMSLAGGGDPGVGMWEECEPSHDTCDVHTPCSIWRPEMFFVLDNCNVKGLVWDTSGPSTMVEYELN